MSNAYTMDKIIEVAEDLCVPTAIRTLPGWFDHEGGFPFPSRTRGHLALTVATAWPSVPPEPWSTQFEQELRSDRYSPDPQIGKKHDSFWSQRSVRVYVDEPVEKDEEFCKCWTSPVLPWRSNRQADNLRWVVIGGPAQVHRVAPNVH